MKTKFQYTVKDAKEKGMGYSRDQGCPECGSPWFGNKNMCGDGHRVCYVCHQDWWTDIEYKNIAKRQELPEM